MKTDPEFIERFDNFAFDEVINMPDIGGKEVDGRTRHMAFLAMLLGCPRSLNALTCVNKAAEKNS